jgi:hypothetical protein
MFGCSEFVMKWEQEYITRSRHIVTQVTNKQNKLRGLSLRANYTDRATAA